MPGGYDGGGSSTGVDSLTVDEWGMPVSVTASVGSGGATSQHAVASARFDVTVSRLLHLAGVAGSGSDGGAGHWQAVTAWVAHRTLCLTVEAYK